MALDLPRMAAEDEADQIILMQKPAPIQKLWTHGGRSGRKARIIRETHEVRVRAAEASARTQLYAEQAAAMERMVARTRERRARGSGGVVSLWN